MCSYIFRWFFKLTGLIPAYLYLKPRLYYSSKKAKKVTVILKTEPLSFVIIPRLVIIIY